MSEKKLKESSFLIPVTLEEKKMLHELARLKGYKSTAAYIRDRALTMDMSNQALAVILLAYIENKIKDLAPKDKIDWENFKKERKQTILTNISMDLIGMEKEKKEKYMKKLSKTIDVASQIKEELEDLLLLRKEKIDKLIEEENNNKENDKNE